MRQYQSIGCQVLSSSNALPYRFSIIKGALPVRVHGQASIPSGHLVVPALVDRPVSKPVHAHLLGARMIAVHMHGDHALGVPPRHHTHQLGTEAWATGGGYGPLRDHNRAPAVVLAGRGTAIAVAAPPVVIKRPAATVER